MLCHDFLVLHWRKHTNVGLRKQCLRLAFPQTRLRRARQKCPSLTRHVSPCSHPPPRHLPEPSKPAQRRRSGQRQDLGKSGRIRPPGSADWKNNDSPIARASKWLSAVRRHNHDIKYRDHGFVAISDIIDAFPDQWFRHCSTPSHVLQRIDEHPKGALRSSSSRGGRTCAPCKDIPLS